SADGAGGTRETLTPTPCNALGIESAGVANAEDELRETHTGLHAGGLSGGIRGAIAELALAVPSPAPGFAICGKCAEKLRVGVVIGEHLHEGRMRPTNICERFETRLIIETGYTATRT